MEVHIIWLINNTEIDKYVPLLLFVPVEINKYVSLLLLVSVDIL